MKLQKYVRTLGANEEGTKSRVESVQKQKIMSSGVVSMRTAISIQS